MTSDSDSALLNAFSRDRDEKAFRIFAERHLALIFHTALRRTGNHPLSEEIAQNVLCAVARKAASLARQDTPIPGWLHRATLFEASKAMRAEDSRQRRIREDQRPQDDPLPVPAEPALWQQALPHLDLALDRLPERDRQVLLLHFFENLSFPKIASRVGRSPAAVQKQSTRALEKLAKLLRGRGVALPIGVIVTGLATESARSAPATLLHTALPAALGAGASAGLTSHSLALVISSHSTKSLAVCIALVIAAPLCWQQLAIARVENELASLPLAPPVRSVSTAKSTSWSPDRRYPQISGSMAVGRLMEECQNASGSRALWLLFKEKLEAADPQELAAALDALRKEKAQPNLAQSLAKSLAEALATRDLPLAMEKTAHDWPQKDLFLRFASQDPAAARAWLAGVQAQPDFTAELQQAMANRTGSSPLEPGRNSLEDFQRGLLAELVRRDASSALDFLKSYPPDTWQAAMISEAAWQHSQPPSLQEAENWMTVIRSLTGGTYRKAMDQLASFPPQMPPSQFDLHRADALIQAAGLTTAEREDFAQSVVRQYLHEKEGPVTRDRDEEVQEWLATGLSPEAADRIARESREWVDSQFDATASSGLAIITVYQDGSSEQEQAIMGLSGNVMKGKNLEQALSLADKLADPEKRRIYLQKLRENSQR